MMKRISSIDITRGFVMIVMALDHVRDYLHVHSITQNPVNLDTTTPALYFTRWITHICAPTFVFLAGTSAYIYFKKGDSAERARTFLLTRGVWLIALELILVNLILWFDLRYRTLIFEVIGTIGFGFIILSFLLKLSWKTIGIMGICIIVLHGLFPLIAISDSSLIKRILSPLFLSGALVLKTNFMFIMTYPPIPWLGIMLTGFAAGKLFENDQSKRRSIFLQIGLASLLLFVAIRFINIYGDPIPWLQQKSSVFTFMSFMNVNKYPPSMLFCLATLGITFMVLSIAERLNNKTTRLISVFGSVPLFYFVLHLLLIHTIMLVMVFLQGYHWNDLLFTNFNLGRPTAKSGVSLKWIYVIWICVVAAVYPLCKWYSNYKLMNKEKRWLRYF